MGYQYTVGLHTFELRRESVIFYDGKWYEEPPAHSLFGDGPTQTVEIDKKYLALIIAYFDDPRRRELYGLTEMIDEHKEAIDSGDM